MKKMIIGIIACLLLLTIPFTARSAPEALEVDVIADYGATGDGLTNDRLAIQNAIDAVHDAGGGTVILTAGKTFSTTNIILKSNVTLHFGDGAKLKQCTDINAYVKPVADGYEPYIPLYGRNFTDTTVKYNHTWYSNYPFIYAGEGTTNVKITGKGIIEMTPGAASNGSQTICICPIGFYRVTGYEISDITIQNYCTYAIMPYTTNNGLIKNVTIKDAVYGSGDGISLMNSQNIRITGCNITTNDDAVYIFSSYADPRAANWWSSENPQPSKNIEIDHNKLTVTWLDTKAMGFILWGAGCPDQSLVEVKDIYIHDNEFNTMGIWNNHPYDSETRIVPMKNIRFENNIIADGVQSNFYTIPMSDVYGYDCMTTMHNADFETTGEAYWVTVGSAGAANNSVGQDGTWYGYINHSVSGSELYQGLKLVGGQYYTFSAKTQTSGDICQMFVQDQVTGQIIAVKEFVNTPWREVSMSFEIPTTGNYQIGIQSGDSTEGWAYIDSASLELSVKEGSAHSIMTIQVPTDFDPELAKTYDLGTRFSAKKAGTITKVRIYANAGTNSVHQVRIWDYATQTVIAGPYDWNVSTDTTGWVEFTLPEALHIDANKDYMVSVTNGVNDYYARGKDTINNFEAPILNGELVTYVASGAFSTSVGTMPTRVNKNMNYFRDIVFTADEVQPEEDPEDGTSEQSIFTTQIPNDYDPNKNAQYDLGTIFSVKKAGTITKVRIYAIAGTNSNHTIRFWDAETGTMLVKYENWAVNVTSDGWITYDLPTPITVEADKQYMISVTNGIKDYYPRGKNAPNNFDSAILNGDLVTYVGSGRWGNESDTAMPANVNRNMCYFRDIVFVADEEEDTTQPSTSEQTIFTIQTPNTSRSDSFYELGTLFSTDCDGVITKVRLYTTSAESGIHTVRIWDYANSELLAGPYEWDVTGGINGWQYFELPTSLKIKANTDYIVAISNNADNKVYSRGDQGGNNALEAPLTNGNLHTYAKSGMYTKTAGAMPNSAIVINYFRDIVFVADTVSEEAADTTALQAVYDIAQVRNEGDYTQASWKPFAKALNVARILLADENVTQNELDTAEQTLTAAMNALVEIKVLSTPVIVLSQSIYTYDGTAKTPSVTVKDGNTVLDTSEYTVSYENNLNAGTANVIITDVAGGFYKVSGQTSFTIGQVTVTVTANDITAALYSTMPELTYSVSGLLGSDQLTTQPTLTCLADMTVLGDYAIIPSGADAGSNYSISYVNGTLTVDDSDKQELRALVNEASELSGASYTVASWNALQDALTEARNVLNDSGATTPQIDAATAQLTAAVNDLTKIKVVTSPIISLEAVEFIYNGNAYTPAVIVKDGDTVIPADNYDVTYSNNINAGTATVTITAKTTGEYSVSGNTTFTIAPAVVTITADSKSCAPGSVMPPLTYKVTGLCGNDKLIAEPTLTCDANMSEAGTYAITVSNADAGSNYTIRYVGNSLTVTTTPPTGDSAAMLLCGIVMLICLCMIVVLSKKVKYTR